MSIVGNKDKISISGAYNISNTGVIGVTGSTGFPATVHVGDSVVVGTAEYVIKTLLGSTGMTVFTEELGATGIPVQTSQTIYVQQKPKYVKRIVDPSTIAGRQDIYGVDEIEMGASGPTGFVGTPGPGHAGWNRVVLGLGTVTDLTVTNAGSMYASAPSVTFSSGAAAATSTISTGKVTGFTVTNGGTYSAAPTATLVGSTGFTFNTKDDVNGTNDTVSTNSFVHHLANGDPIKFLNGATGSCGLVNNTTYYARVTGATGVISLYDTSAHAIAGGGTGLTNLTADGGTGATNRFVGINATADVVTGGRIGRKLYETMVVLGDASQATMGDAEDTIFPDV